MAFEIYKNSTQMAQFVVLLIFSPIGIVVTILRFVAVSRSARNPSAEDWFAVLATIFFILTNLGGLMAISILNGRQIDEELMDSLSDYSHMRKWDICSLYFYFAQTVFVKLSVLALYNRVFGLTRSYRIWIYFFGCLQLILFVIFCVFQGLQCRPLAKYFNITIPGHCTDEGVVILGGETPNSLIDFGIVILAMFMIRPLHLEPAVKYRLGFLFGLGFLVGLIGFVKIAITYRTSTLYAFSMISLWTCVQMFTSLLCCCLPLYSPFLPMASKFWSRFSPRGTGYPSLGFASRFRSNNHTNKNTSGRSAYEPNTYKPNQDWVPLDDNNSNKGSVWAGEQFTQTSAVGESHSRDPDLEASGIHVERQFDVA